MKHFLGVAAALLGAVTAASAVPIVFDFRGIASGALGAADFENKEFRIRVHSNTDAIYDLVPHVPVCPADPNARIWIESVGSASFEPSLEASVFYNQDLQIVGFWRLGIEDLLDIQTSLGGSYDLKTSVGPVEGPRGIWMEYIMTDEGALKLYTNSVTHTSFQATVVPEPASLAVVSAGLLALVWRRRP